MAAAATESVLELGGELEGSETARNVEESALRSTYNAARDALKWAAGTKIGKAVKSEVEKEAVKGAQELVQWGAAKLKSAVKSRSGGGGSASTKTNHVEKVMGVQQTTTPSTVVSSTTGKGIKSNIPDSWSRAWDKDNAGDEDEHPVHLEDHHAPRNAIIQASNSYVPQFSGSTLPRYIPQATPVYGTKRANRKRTSVRAPRRRRKTSSS